MSVLERRGEGTEVSSVQLGPPPASWLGTGIRAHALLLGIGQVVRGEILRTQGHTASLRGLPETLF